MSPSVWESETKSLLAEWGIRRGKAFRAMFALGTEILGEDFRPLCRGSFALGGSGIFHLVFRHNREGPLDVFLSSTLALCDKVWLIARIGNKITYYHECHQLTAHFYCYITETSTEMLALIISALVRLNSTGAYKYMICFGDIGRILVKSRHLGLSPYISGLVGRT